MKTLKNAVIGYAMKENWKDPQAVEHMTDNFMRFSTSDYDVAKRTSETWEGHGYKLALTKEKLKPVTLESALIYIFDKEGVECRPVRDALKLDRLDCSDCEAQGYVSCNKSMASWFKSLK